MKRNEQPEEKWVNEVGIGVPDGYKIESKVVGGKKVGPHRVTGPNVTVGTFSTLSKALAEAIRHSQSKRDDDEPSVDGPKF
ncbi:hypothetical protein SAMN05216374_2339 [Tardiphaga sp. OK246]|jgi:hypothetical protein|uniref:hypothetical protein n=1 Tax=Tardiphaga sp. OK246 TaxID=1855307 RepID=UPI000B6D4384|nr:hypothetical protein [Tardiphaga sp. OK246]SNT02186.1 hypothetical protein SAMN05216374_2339 [Tardiphaga sp. OK246]